MIQNSLSVTILPQAGHDLRRILENLMTMTKIGLIDLIKIQDDPCALPAARIILHPARHAGFHWCEAVVFPAKRCGKAR